MTDVTKLQRANQWHKGSKMGKWYDDTKNRNRGNGVRGAAYDLLALEVQWVRVELRGCWRPLGAKMAQVTISMTAPTVKKQQRSGVK